MIADEGMFGDDGGEQNEQREIAKEHNGSSEWTKWMFFVGTTNPE